MKCLGWIAVCAVGLVLIVVDRSDALPGGCLNCAKNRGFPHEKCCSECPVCRHNFDVEAPPDPGCKKVARYHYGVEKVTGCHKETYDRLDAAVEVLPQKGCKKSYQFHYDVEKPCDCYDETYDTYDFEVVAPKKEKKCHKLKLEAFADHPVRECQCDCHNRRYVNGMNSPNRTLSNISDKSTSGQLVEGDTNSIRRVKRQVLNAFKIEDPEEARRMEDLKRLRNPHRPRLLRNAAPFQQRFPNGRRIRRRENQGFQTTQGSFVCHCVPAGQSDGGKTKEHYDMVGAPRRTESTHEKPVYIGDSAHPITYDQIKRHMDALPKSDSNGPTTNDIIGNLTVLFYDIYQQKHRKNFTLPLKYGTRTVVEKGDGLQQYDIKPIEGEYRPPTQNRIASKSLNVIGRKIDRKTGRPGPRRNRIQKGP